MIDFNNVLENLIDVGFFSIVLPFVLVYAVVFGVLQKSRIFSSGNEDKQVKNINAIIAFVFALFVVASVQTVRYIQNIIVDIVLVLMFLLCVMILLGFIFGKDYFKHLFHDKDDKVHKGLIWTVAGVVILVSLGILFSILGVWDWLEDFLDWDWNDGSWFTELVVIVAIGGVLYWITKDSKDSKNGSSDK